jgi:ABC-2 type transport system ATP-binding protein
MAIIHLDKVTVTYGTRKALDGVTCDIDGGAVGLLGLNGAGKSTLLKTLLGFLRADEGVVEMFGLRMPRHSLNVRQRLGYMPERDVVSPKVSAVSFLTYCGCLFGMTRVDAMERAHEVLNYVGLGSSRYRKMETYSTGMRQRVKFAQALIHDPKLLLLDEPTSGLDPDGRLEMLHLIHELAVTRNVTILLSSHLLPDIDHVCSRVVMIHQGKVVQDSDIGSLTSQCEGAFALRLRDNVPGFLARIEEVGFTWRDEKNGMYIVTAPNGASVRALFEIGRALKTQIRHLRPVRQSLEEVFMNTIGGVK